MKVACPLCRAEGKDSNGDHLMLWEEGNGFCHAKHGKLTKEQIEGTPVIETKKRYSRLTIEEVESYPIGTTEDRVVPEPIEVLYAIRHSIDPETGEINKVFYPSMKKGTTSITGYKVREIGTSRKFGPNVGTPPEEVWGKWNCKVKAHHLLIVEGEEDCVAASLILHSSPRVAFDIVSLPNGASLGKTVMDDVDFFSQYKKVYLALDADPVGKKVQAEISEWLSGFTDVYNVLLGSHGKDASEYWTGGYKSEFRKAIKEAKSFQPDGIVNGIDIPLSDLMKPTPEGYVIPFEGIQDKLHGVRKAEILTVCAGSGIGKTTVVREITKALIEEGLSVASVALEDQMDIAAQALVALDMNIPLATYKHKMPSEEEIQPHYDKMVANGKTFFFRHFGGLDASNLMTNLYHYAKRKEVDFIVLDHLSMVISATESNNERKDIDMLMTNLAKMVVETGVGLIQIVHLKRGSGDTSFAKGGEVELTDLRGSAALEQLSWGVLALERDQQSEDNPNQMKARVLKNRTWGYTGLCDKLEYNPKTGRIISIKDRATE